MIATNLKNRVGAIAATVAISCALCVMLAGCATENSGNVTSDQDEYSAVEKATITTRRSRRKCWCKDRSALTLP